MKKKVNLFLFFHHTDFIHHNLFDETGDQIWVERVQIYSRSLTLKQPTDEHWEEEGFDQSRVVIRNVIGHWDNKDLDFFFFRSELRWHGCALPSDKLLLLLFNVSRNIKTQQRIGQIKIRLYNLNSLIPALIPPTPLPRGIDMPPAAPAVSWWCRASNCGVLSSVPPCLMGVPWESRGQGCN